MKRKPAKKKAAKKVPEKTVPVRGTSQDQASVLELPAGRRIANRYPHMKPTEAGQCYMNAFNFVFANSRNYDGIKVVHGYPQNERGEVLGHAWVEWKDLCYDPYLDIEEPRARYYALNNIDPSECRYYTPEVALKLMTTQKVYGPWEVVRLDVAFVEKRIWAVKDRRPETDGISRFWIWNELVETESLLDQADSCELNELSTELARAVVGSGDLLLCHEADNREVRGLCPVFRSTNANGGDSEELSYSYWAHEDYFAFIPPLKLKDLLAIERDLTFHRKRRMVALVERDEFAKLVHAISVQSPTTSESLTKWLRCVGYSL